MSKLLIFLCIFITSCASGHRLLGGPARTAYEVILDFRIKSYYYGCDYIDIIYIKKDGNGYIGEAYCNHYGVVE